MKEAVVVSAVRTAVGKAPRGILKDTRPDDVAAVVFKEAVSRVPGLKMEEVDDVVLGCAFPESDQGLNLARVVAMRAGFPDTVPGQTVNRFCSSGLQAIATAAHEIMVGGTEIMVAGGVEFMSQVPIMGLTPSPNPYLVEHNPQVYTSMGLTAENVAEKFGVTRQDQDELALRSQQNAGRAIKEGRFKDEIVSVSIPQKKGAPLVFDTDEHPRPNTTKEALAGLRPAFKKDGTVTAGNASGINDGAAAVVVMSAEKAKALGIQPLVRIKSYATAGVAPEIMGTGPVPSSQAALKKAGLMAKDLDLVEANEAFAAQAAYVNRTMGWDLEKVNVNGGAIALGHPIGASGARILVTLIHEMKKRQSRYGLATLCVGGGMGGAMIVERM